MEWLGHARTSFHHAPETLTLRKKDGTITDLLSVCKESTPPCRLNPFLFNGHLQTMWTSVKRDPGPPVYYRRKVFDSDNQTYNGSFAVDFVVPPFSETNDSLPERTVNYTVEEFEGIGSLDSRPMLVVLHGLSGGSYEIYLRYVLETLIAEGDNQWEACVVNSRGCAKHKITSPTLYNARTTWDCRQTVSWLRRTFPNRPLFGAGFSLGANILTNYIAEEGDNCLLKAAVVISNPWNLDLGSNALKRTYLGLEVYQKTMGTNLRVLFELHAEEMAKNPKFDLAKIRSAKYLYEFDRTVQCPAWGYPTEGAYYRDASSTDALMAVKIPIFAINAEDDPIAVNEALPYEEIKQTPYGVMCTTSLGGHLSWFEIGGHRWHAYPACNFLNKMAFEIEVPAEIAATNGNAKGKLDNSRYEVMRRKWQ